MGGIKNAAGIARQEACRARRFAKMTIVRELEMELHATAATLTELADTLDALAGMEGVLPLRRGAPAPHGRRRGAEPAATVAAGRAAAQTASLHRRIYRRAAPKKDAPPPRLGCTPSEKTPA